MKQQILARFTALLCLLALASCVNLKPVPSQTRSFALGPVDTTVAPEALASGDSIYILRPQVPTYQDGSRLNYRSASGEVMSLPGARWAEPLAEGIARATSLYLAPSKEASVQGYYPWPNTSAEAVRLSLNFQRFGATESGEVKVVARWTLKKPGGKSQSGQFVSETLRWVPGQPETLVAAYNQALQALADSLKGAIEL
jgi:uncharacterized lipoprotein YmbA